MVIKIPQQLTIDDLPSLLQVHPPKKPIAWLPVTIMGLGLVIILGGIILRGFAPEWLAQKLMPWVPLTNTIHYAVFISLFGVLIIAATAVWSYCRETIYRKKYRRILHQSIDISVLDIPDGSEISISFVDEKNGLCTVRLAGKLSLRSRFKSLL